MENLKQFSDIFGSKLVLIVFVYILNLLSNRKSVSTFFTYCEILIKVNEIASDLVPRLWLLP